MITEYKDDFAFPPGPAEDFENTCATMLQLQTQVAEHFLEEGIAYFDVTSKCHMLQELSILARHTSAHLGVLRGRHDAKHATSGAELRQGQHPGPHQFENGPPLPPRIAFLVQGTSRIKASLSVFLTPTRQRHGAKKRCHLLTKIVPSVCWVVLIGA